jgi:hypothetical protein
MGLAGSEAAREVAHIILEEDNLRSAIERGRTTCVNIQKAIHFILATYLSEILVMLAAHHGALRRALIAGLRLLQKRGPAQVSLRVTPFAVAIVHNIHKFFCFHRPRSGKMSRLT